MYILQKIGDFPASHVSCGFFGGVGCIHWQNMPTPCLRGRFLPRFWPTRCVGFVRRLRGSYAVLFGADLFFLFADEWGLLGLHFFHFELLGIHFLSFWPFGPVRPSFLSFWTFGYSFPFILAFWACSAFMSFILNFWVFISCHFGLLGLFGFHFLSFWPFGFSFPFIVSTSTGCGCHHIQ